MAHLEYSTDTSKTMVTQQWGSRAGPRVGSRTGRSKENETNECKMAQKSEIK
jgi:hypothetical protein